MMWRTDTPGWETATGSPIEMLMTDGSVVSGVVEIEEHWTGEEDIAVSRFLGSDGKEVEWLKIEAWRAL